MVTQPLESVGVTVTGLTGPGLVLQLNGGSNLSITANGNATFSTQLPSGASYVVSVLTQPTSTSQICAVTNGSGVTGSSNVTTIQVACTLDLTTTTTHPVIDSGLPVQVSGSISQVISCADSEALGSMLTIPTNSVGFETPIFAVDSNQNPILIAYANSASTTLSAGSTAVALVLQTLGVIPSETATFPQLVAAVQSSAGYGGLVTAINSSLSAGTPPLQADSVVQNVATVMNQVLYTISPQSTSSVPTAAAPRLEPPIVLPMQTATPPLPYQIFGSSLSKKAVSVYIDSVTESGDVNVVNQMPIQFHASSVDLNNATLDAGKSLPAVSLFLGQLTAKPVDVAGNSGKPFTLTIDEQDPTTQQANLTQSMTDLIALLLNTATGLASNGQQIPGVEACAQQAAQATFASLGSTWNTILVSSATGSDLSLSLANTFTGSVFFQGVKLAFTCATKGTASAAASKALANLASYLVPASGVWKSIQLAVGAAGPLTEGSLTLYYWNKAQPVEVCESKGALVACGYTYTFKGAQFNTWAGNAGCPGQCRITGSITLAQPLGPNLAQNVAPFSSASAGISGPITPLSFDFTDGIVHVTQSFTSDYGFAFDTDATGNITGFGFQMSYQPDSGLYACYPGPYGNQETALGVGYEADIGGHGTVGTWTGPQTDAQQQH